MHGAHRRPAVRAGERARLLVKRLPALARERARLLKKKLPKLAGYAALTAAVVWLALAGLWLVVWGAGLAVSLVALSLTLLHGRRADLIWQQAGLMIFPAWQVISIVTHQSGDGPVPYVAAGAGLVCIVVGKTLEVRREMAAESAAVPAGGGQA